MFDLLSVIVGLHNAAAEQPEGSSQLTAKPIKFPAGDGSAAFHVKLFPSFALSLKLLRES